MFEAQYPGIAIQAIGLTFGTLASLLVLPLKYQKNMDQFFVILRYFWGKAWEQASETKYISR